jgi:uncharacterized protein YkwD
MQLWRGVLLVLVACLAIGAPATAATTAHTAPARQASATTTLERGVLAEVNALRRSRGLAPLRLSRQLSTAARTHSTAMARRGFFRHESADGSPFWQRVRRYYAAGGYGHWSVGENLLWSSPNVDARGALRMWLSSPPHRRTLLTREWREIGLSAVHVASAPGTYGGREVTILTADFGVRR